MNKKINKGRFFRNIILILLVLGSIGVYMSNRYIKTKGFNGLGEFITNYRTNKSLVENATPQNIQLLIADKDFHFIENKRQESLARGIQINIGDNYVDCKIVYNEKDTIKGEIRLKGHMTDHLEGEKWSFRVKGEEEVMGMYRFSLQNPGTRNYAYEWIYHELLGNEEVIHLKYDFIHLKLNDSDLGIYAVEEHFGQHVLRDNERPKGAILRWNPELYWENRIDEIQDNYLDEQYSNYSSSFAEAYDKGVIKKEDELVQTYIEGAALLEAFRRGEKSTSEVFDIQKMASFHAVIDLVGGYHSLDWSDVKLYYNSETKKIEPVGYESFSVRETYKVAGQRTPEDYSTLGYNYHDRLFADHTFFAAYIQCLERICDEAYFDKFTATIEEKLNEKRGVLAQEYAYIKFSFKPYYDNIERIRHNIQLPKAAHGFLEEKNDSVLHLSIAPVSDYPLEVIALKVNGKKELKLDAPFIIPPKARDTYAKYFDVYFSHDVKKVKDLVLLLRIVGSSTVFEVLVSELPSFRLNLDNKDTLLAPSVDSSIVWLNDSIAVFRNKNTTLRNHIFVPNGKTLLLNPGQTLTFEAEGHIDIQGEMLLTGSTDNPVVISSKGHTEERIKVSGGVFLASETTFFQIEGKLIVADKSTLNFETTRIAETSEDLVTAKHSTITMTNCVTGTMSSFGVFDRCLVRFKNVTAKKGDVFLTSYGSDVEMYASKIEDFSTFSNLNYSSNFSAWSSMFNKVGLLSELNNGSAFTSIKGIFKNADQGFNVDLETEMPGASTYFLQGNSGSFKIKEERIKV